MFRPPSYHPHGGPPRHNGPYPAHSLGMGGGAPFVPPAFPMHGRGGFHPPFQGGPYHGFPPSGPPPSVRPPPPPGSPPFDATPPPPPIEGIFRSTSKPAPPPPPPIPKDPEMVKNIEVLSSFVVKNGPQFENMARAKQAGDPKFAFLFGGDRGTDAALGLDFYNWKKEHLVWVEERTRPSPADQQRVVEPTVQGQHGAPAEAGLSHESPGSPAGSDMDMEDDFAPPDSTGDNKAGFDDSPTVPLAAVERKSGLSPTSTERRLGATSPAGEWKPDFSSPTLERRPALSLSASERKIVLPPSESVELKASNSLNLPVDRDSSLKGANRGLSAQISMPETQVLGGSSHEDHNPRDSHTSTVRRETALSDVPKRRDTRRRTGFDRPRMEDVSPHSSPVRAEQLKETFPVVHPSRKGASGNGLREVPMKPSRWGPEPALEHLGSGVSPSDKMPETVEATSVGKGNKKPDNITPRKVDNSSTKDRCQSPDVATKSMRAPDDCNAKDNEKQKPRSVSDQPAVDEFGRLLRQGGSDSDADDDHYGGRKKRRRTSSRSRSGSPSPGDMRSRHWSPGRSPHRRVRRSRSWSRSPRRNRSHTPPREGRWGGEGRGDRGTLEKGGRRAGRGVGAPPPTCFDFMKGKCFRGSSCRFLHEDSHGAIGDQGGRWSGGRGRDREQSHSSRAGEEGERNWGGRTGDKAKLRRAWDPDEQAMEDDSREMKLIAELKKQEHESPSNESLKQEKGNPENPVKSSEEPGRTEIYQPVKSSSEFSNKNFAPPLTVTSSLQLQPTFPMRLISQSGPQIAVLPNLLSQQQAALASNSASANQKLVSLVSSASQQSPLMVSPTPHSQQLQFSPVLPPPQQPAFSLTLQPQNSGYQALPSSSQTNGFASSTSHQQPAFNSTHNVLSESPSLPTLQPTFAALPLGRSQSTFNALQHPSFAAPFPNTHGPGGIQFRPPMGGTQPQPQMLQGPLVQNLQPRPNQAWLPSGVGPPVSFSLGPPQSLQQPPPQAPPPQVSAASTAVYSYSLPLSYAMPSYSTPSTKTVAPRPPPIIHDQYDPLADSLEPAPPGSVEKKGLISNNQSSLQENTVQPSAVEQWRHNPGGMSAPLMTNAGEVVLENVSPGLPVHVDNGVTGSSVMGATSPARQPQITMENVSPTDVGATLNGKALTKLGGSEHQVIMENVSPPDQNPTETEKGYKESAPQTKVEKKVDKEGRVLNLIRKAVAEHVKDLLKPTWKGGHMSKEAFKTIAKKAVDKVMGALESKGQIPKGQEKLEVFMKTSKPKIARLVQGYVDKYVKA